MSALEETLLYQLHALCIPAPVREHKFHPIRKWRFDLAWPGEMLAVEVEGGKWTQGRHQRPQGFEDDCVKYAEAVLLGWRVIRVTGDMIADGRALQYVEMAFKSPNTNALITNGLAT